MLAAPHPGGGKARAKGHPPHGGNAEQSPGQPVLHPGKHGLAHPRRKAHGKAADHAAHAVAVHPRRLNGLAHSDPRLVAEHGKGLLQQRRQIRLAHPGKVRGRIRNIRDPFNVGCDGHMLPLQ